MKKILYKLIIFFLLFVSALCAETLKDQTALVIIDMQPFYILRNPHNEKPENFTLINQVIKEQQLAIEYAKKIGLPIIFVEYKSNSPTTSELTKLVDDYANKKTITKTTAGLFDPFNSGLETIKNHLEDKNIKTLIMVGANGGACVLESIKGAVFRNYNVLTYTKGIADFNYEKVLTPYRYFEMGTISNTPCENCVFAEFDDFSDIAIRLTQEVDVAKNEIRINQSRRDNIKLNSSDSQALQKVKSE